MSPNYTAAAAVVCLTALVTLLPSGIAQEAYSTEFDQTDLSALLADAGRVDTYVQCFLAEANDNCDEAGRRVKAVLAEAMTNDCAKCSQRQRLGLAKAVEFLRRERPADWERLQSKFDPSGSYVAAHPELVQ